MMLLNCRNQAVSSVASLTIIISLPCAYFIFFLSAFYALFFFTVLAEFDFDSSNHLVY